jgi:hypothetical protein
MPRLRLDDGWTIDLPDDASKEEVAAIVSDHYGVATPREVVQASEAEILEGRVPETALTSSSGLQMPPLGPSDEASDPPNGRIGTLVVRSPGHPVEIGPYQHDRETDPDLLRKARIRELQQRSGKPDPVHPVHNPPPADNPGRDNWRPVLPRR